MITQVQVNNFRSLAKETIDLGKLTVLVGRNGAGKSSVVDVFRFVRDALRPGGLDDAVMLRQGLASMRRWAPSRPYDVEITLTVESRDLWGQYSFCLSSGKEGDFKVKRESCHLGLSAALIDEHFERRGDKWVTPPVHQKVDFLRLNPATLVLPQLSLFSNGGASRYVNVLRELQAMQFYSIFPNTLRELQKPSATKFLEEHGQNLSTVLRILRKTPSYDHFLNDLNKVIPDIKDLRVQQVSGFLVTQLQHKFGDGHTAWFDLFQESDGTLRILGLLAAIHQRARSGLIAIEEPELTLHPGALSVLADVLLQASARRQLLITTQSPDLVTRFDAEDLRVVERNDGITQVAPIAEEQRQIVDDELFSAGDLMRVEGLRRSAAHPR